MKNTILVIIAIAASFCFGFATKTILTKDNSNTDQIKRVTSIGGIFFKCKEPKKVREWYQTHLGINTNQFGAVFEWRQASDSTKKGYS